MAKKKKKFGAKAVAQINKVAEERGVLPVDNGGDSYVREEAAPKETGFAAKARQKTKAEITREKNAATLRSEVKRSKNFAKVKQAADNITPTGPFKQMQSQAKRQADRSALGFAAKQSGRSYYNSLSTNRKAALSGNGGKAPLIKGPGMAIKQQTSSDIVKRRTKTDKEYAKKVDAGVNQFGLTAPKLVAGLPTEEELSYRKKYGYDEQAKKILEDRYRNSPVTAGFIDAWRPESIEKTMEEQYGKKDTFAQRAGQTIRGEKRTRNGLDDDLLQETRGSGKYMVGNVAGQMSQFIAMSPVSSALEGAALARVGVGGARAGKAIRGVKTTKDALKVLGTRVGVDQAISLPINLLDAMKENRTEDIIKRFGLNQGLDLVFGGLSEVPMLRRNIHYSKAFNLNNAANEATKASEKKALKQASRRELDKLDKKTLDAAKRELEQADEIRDIVRNGRRGRQQQAEDISQAMAETRRTHLDAKTDTESYINGNGEPVANAADLGYNNVARGVNNGADATGIRTSTRNVSETAGGIPEGPAANRARLEGGADAGASPISRSNVSVKQRTRMTEGGITNTNLQEAGHPAFSNALDAGRRDNPFGGYVDGKTTKELRDAGARTFLSDDGTVGVAVESNGNIVGAFKSPNSPYKGAVHDMIITARANGGTKMDCYGIDLVNMYERSGYVPVARVRFNPEYASDPMVLRRQPDVYFLMKNTDDLDTVIEKNLGDQYHLSTQRELDSLPVFDDVPGGEEGYARALNYRDNLLRRQETPTGGAMGQASRAEGNIRSANLRETRGDIVRGDLPTQQMDNGLPYGEPGARRFGNYDNGTRFEDIPGIGDEPLPRSTENAADRINGIRERTVERFADDAEPTPTRPIQAEDMYPEEFARGEQLQTAINEAGDRAGRYRYGVPRANEEGQVTSAIDTLVGRGELSPEAQTRIAEDTFLDGQNLKASRGVNELRSEAAERWNLNPEAEMSKLTNAVSNLKKPNQVPAGFASFQEFFADAEQGLIMAQRTGNVELETNILEKSAQVASNMGAGMRQYQELLKATPAARANLIDRQIAEIERRYSKQLKGKSINLSDATRQLIRDADPTNPTEMASAMKTASEEIWNQVPASRKEKLDAWRMTSMLMNPRTHARNMVGNALFRPAARLKDLLAVPMERAAIARGVINPEDATKAVLNRASASDRRLIDAAVSVWDANKDFIRGETKYFENVGFGLLNRPMDSGVFMAGREGGNPIINWMRKAADGIAGFNGKLLDGEDVLFMKGQFVDSYAKTLKARGLDPANMTPEQIQDVIEVASEEALRSTYRDASQIATTINSLRHVNPSDPAWRQALAFAIDTTLPFVKTPVNILRRSADYSPIGLINGGAKLSKAIREGNSKAAVEAIDRLSAGATGSGVLLIGAWLGKNEKLTAKLSPGQDGYYESDRGLQNYSLNLGGENGTNVTLDWAAPMAIPLFTGVQLANMSDSDSADLVAGLVDVLGQSFDPVKDMSVLQGPVQMLESIRKSDAPLVEGPINVGLNYGSQMIPTVSGQIARMIDPVRRDTTSYADTTTRRTIEKWRNKQIAKLPGLSRTLEPYINVWGEEQRGSDSLPVRAFNQFLNPGYVQNDKTDDVDREIVRLNAGDPNNSVTPTKLFINQMNLGDETIRLDPKDVTTYNRVRGQESKRALRDLFATDEYQNASDADKRKMINNVYKKAGITGKQESLVQHGEDPWKVYTDDLQGKKKPDYADAKEASVDPKTYYGLMTTKDWDTNGNGYANKAEIINYLNDRDDLTGAQKAVIFSKLSTSKYNPYGEGIDKADPNSTGRKRYGRRRRGYRRRGRKRSTAAKKVQAPQRTASSKAFSASHTATKMRSDIKSAKVGAAAITQAADGLSKSQKKALLKLMKKRFQV